MRARILSVSADPLLLESLARELASYGYDALLTSTGTAAVELLDREEIDLVLVDASLPDMTSAEAIRALRQFRGTSFVPLVLLTERSAHAARTQGVEFGADELLDKPIDPPSLLLRVQTLLRLKRAQDEVARRDGEMARLVREHRGIVESLVHDLRNPLAIAHANVTWVREHLGDTDSDLCDALDDTSEALGRLRTMSDDITMAARFSRPDQLLQREWIHLGDLLDGVVARHEEAARARNVSLNVAVPERKLELSGDAAVLRRVFDSIIESTLKHTPASGRVELSARPSPSSDEIEIAVRNTGIPLPPEERDQIALAIDHGAPLRPSGMGLKLYFCRRAIEAHHGEIEVVETEEWPTALVMRFPAAG